MDDYISCGKSSLLLTSDQQEHLLLLRGVEVPWTGHSSWTHSSVRESVISSAGWSCILHKQTHRHKHTVISSICKTKNITTVKMTQILFLSTNTLPSRHPISRNLIGLKNSREQI